jgi:hypothetical protein
MLLVLQIFDKSEKSKTTDKLKSMLQDYETSPEMQEKLKIAFAEGYTTHEKKRSVSKSTWTTKILRGFMYAIGFYCIIQLIQVFSTVGGSKYSMYSLVLVDSECLLCVCCQCLVQSFMWQ